MREVPAVNPVARLIQATGCALRRAVPDGARVRLVAAFAAVYLIWGSTYLAIRYAIDTLPPFLMAATRFLLPGSVLYVWARRHGAPRPAIIHWRSALIVGGLMLLGGNGGVVWAEQSVPSGMAALLVATIPLWVALITSVTKWQRPSLAVLGSVVLGLAGIALLVGPEQLASGGNGSPLGVGVLLLAAFLWSLGTAYSRGASQPASPFMSNGINMLSGGALLLVAAGIAGEFPRLNLSNVSLPSVLALAYLVVFGSLVAFSAYMWLVKTTTPAQASSNFYVNPVVAVILGWLLAGEPLTPLTLLATAIIVGAVALSIAGGGRKK
jgi:drug/metabolite transporter (DMT)-like permease